MKNDQTRFVHSVISTFIAEEATEAISLAWYLKSFHPPVAEHYTISNS